ncbi:MAG TPA: hypothetical protein PKK26_13895 [Candidatus Wallbacteria bacterium]|nr:hypothetical protein [Candidatus Wallbacteria bacterium]
MAMMFHYDFWDKSPVVLDFSTVAKSLAPLGPVDFVSFEGHKPMNIIWRLWTPLPPWFWNDAAKLATA